MARKTAAEKAIERDRAEQVAWRTYVSRLSHIDDPRDAYHMANQGPSNGQPGGRYYHNLGCHLHANPMDRPSRAEEEEIEKFRERAAAKGNKTFGWAQQ